MSADCWRCKQKAEHLQEQINAAINQAKEEAKQSGQTMAIIRSSGCIYMVVKATETTGLNVVQYISHDSGSTNTG